MKLGSTNTTKSSVSVTGIIVGVIVVLLIIAIVLGIVFGLRAKRRKQNILYSRMVAVTDNENMGSSRKKLVANSENRRTHILI